MQSEKALIREFMQALAEEIQAIQNGNGGSTITVYDGSFVRREGRFFVYKFTTESLLASIEDAETRVRVGEIECNGHIVSVQGSEVAVAIERDFGETIPEAKLKTDASALLEALRKRFEEVLSGQRSLDMRLGQRLFGFAPTTTRIESGELKGEGWMRRISSSCGNVHESLVNRGDGACRVFLSISLRPHEPAPKHRIRVPSCPV